LPERQKATLDSLPTHHLKTARTYHIRLAFQDLYEQPSTPTATAFLKKWYFWVTRSRLEPSYRSSPRSPHPLLAHPDPAGRGARRCQGRYAPRMRSGFGHPWLRLRATPCGRQAGTKKRPPPAEPRNISGGASRPLQQGFGGLGSCQTARSERFLSWACCDGVGMIVS
jgi:hypothetical protein